ncbi:hypothetical protein [Ruegeria hyattellae]|uniref:hypothetical protein n=1 Tax=Ruegeria hyattellae TaxID=3233337 RepID=UPI00355BA695
MSDPALAADHRIIAQACLLTEEFSLKKGQDTARADYARLSDLEARKGAMARIADLEMRYNMARDARHSFMR